MNRIKDRQGFINSDVLSRHMGDGKSEKKLDRIVNSSYYKLGDSYVCRVSDLKASEDQVSSSNSVNKKRIVYQDLVFTLQQPRGREKYHRPVVKPEEDHLLVIGNNTFYQACVDAGLDAIYCDVVLNDEEFQERFKLTKMKYSLKNERSYFVFFEGGVEVNSMSIPEIRLLVGNYLSPKEEGIEVKMHDDENCIEIGYDATDIEAFKSLEGLPIILGEFVRKIGHIRSIDGIKKQILNELYS